MYPSTDKYRMNIGKEILGRGERRDSRGGTDGRRREGLGRELKKRRKGIEEERTEDRRV